jgi:hypothetical protein
MCEKWIVYIHTCDALLTQFAQNCSVFESLGVKLGSRYDIHYAFSLCNTCKERTINYT